MVECIRRAGTEDRLNLFNALLEYLPSTSLHVIPSIIPETVLGTKEPSEKARSAAFELIVAIGHKMKEGGVVKRHKLNGMDEDDDMTESVYGTFRIVIFPAYVCYS